MGFLGSGIPPKNAFIGRWLGVTYSGSKIVTIRSTVFRIPRLFHIDTFLNFPTFSYFFLLFLLD